MSKTLHIRSHSVNGRREKPLQKWACSSQTNEMINNFEFMLLPTQQATIIGFLFGVN